jgi:hypothetical protein
MKGKKMMVAMFTVIALFIGPLGAMGADQTDGLIDLLIKKGIITNEDLKSLEKEMKKEEPKPEEGAGKPEIVLKEDWIKKVEVGYKDGAYIKTTDDRFSLKLNVPLQFSYSYDAFENDDIPDKSTFNVTRARLIPSGNVFFPWLKYYVQITLEQSVNLRDAYVEATYFRWLSPKVGQYKVPFDREFLTSAFALQLINRSVADGQFNLGRDIGLQLSGYPIGNLLEYRAGIFNGSGANKTNVDTDFMYVGRLVFNPFGPVPYSQGALRKPDKPLLSIGVAGAYMPSLNPGERSSLAGVLGNPLVVPVRSDVFQFTTDVAFRYQNFSFEGAYYYRAIAPVESTPAFVREAGYGFNVQSGYFLIPNHLEVAARYSYMNPDTPVEAINNGTEEITGGLSYYFLGHPLKIQANYSYFKRQARPENLREHLVQTQLTVCF